jgi:hypothetical protein
VLLAIDQFSGGSVDERIRRKASESRSNCLDYSTRFIDESAEGTIVSAERRRSLIHYRGRSIDDPIISWKQQAILDRLYQQVRLNKVQHV